MVFSMNKKKGEKKNLFLKGLELWIGEKKQIADIFKFFPATNIC